MESLASVTGIDSRDQILLYNDQQLRPDDILDGFVSDPVSTLLLLLLLMWFLCTTFQVCHVHVIADGLIIAAISSHVGLFVWFLRAVQKKKIFMFNKRNFVVSDPGTFHSVEEDETIAMTEMPTFDKGGCTLSRSFLWTCSMSWLFVCLC